MQYFHDSTVIIGYIFNSTDRWGKQADIVINDEIPNNSSKYVWEECFDAQYDFGSFERGKCGTIKNTIASHFRKIVAELLKRSFSEILKDDEVVCYEIYPLLEEINSNLSGILDLREYIRNKGRDFEGKCYIRYVFLNSDGCVAIHRRNKSFKEIYDELTLIVNDPGDIEVILDGHFLAMNNPNINLVTGDWGHIAKNREKICSCTALTGIIYLKDITL